jgi:hypothetical protein
MRFLVLCFVCGAFLIAAQGGRAEIVDSKATASADEKKKEDKQSPWLLLPVFSSEPKLGTAFGFTAAYMHYFDEKSRVSLFGITGQYTTTESVIIAITSKLSWGADHHRALALLVGGLIKNDYNDFLGTGQPLKTEDDLRALVGRYLYRVKDNWFLGAQALKLNYEIIGQSALDNDVLQTLGLLGFTAGGIGLVVQQDSRDSEFSPTTGWVLNANNIAYRKWIAGDNNYDVYRIDLKVFFKHWGEQVLAVRQNNQLTGNAPASANAPVILRGYKRGQYLGKYMSSLEAEERVRFGKRWGASLFAGVACLYGSGKECTNSENIYPSAGAGVQYVLKPKEGIVANLEYAQGKSDNYGIILKLGYGF